jgi:O-methyltransferase involved in polyketide biosynthesis
LVPADLSHEQLADALARSPFRPTEPTFFAWLGVTQYLAREANLATLGSIAACSAPGSQLVFTYVDQSELGGNRTSGGGERLQMAFAAAREPWVSGFDPSRLGEDLAALGFTLLEDLDGLDAKTRYCPERDLSPMKASHIVHAKIHRQAPREESSECRGPSTPTVRLETQGTRFWVAAWMLWTAVHWVVCSNGW